MWEVPKMSDDLILPSLEATEDNKPSIDDNDLTPVYKAN